MEQTLRQMAGQIMIQALAAVQPDAAVRSALERRSFPGGSISSQSEKRRGRWQTLHTRRSARGSRTVS